MVFRSVQRARRMVRNLLAGHRVQRGRAELHQYWQRPDEANAPEKYLAPAAGKRSELLVGLLEKHAQREARILEVGCNAGRNLAFLHDAGFQNLEAIEISQQAVDLLRRSHPQLKDVSIHVAPVEDVVPKMADGAYDVVYTMAVLEHIHRDSEGIFRDLVRITSHRLVTIEDEDTVSTRHFRRNYGEVFRELGLREVETVRDLTKHGLSAAFVARVLEKPSTGSA